MELCIPRAISNFPHHKLFYGSLSRRQLRDSLSLKPATISRRSRALVYSGSHLVRATTSEETSTSINEQSEEANEGVIIMEESPADKQSLPNEVKISEVPKEAITLEIPKEEPSTGEQLQIFEFLEQLQIKLDSEDGFSILIYGSGSLVALWLASAIVGAIDSIPLVPKALELVGLAFSIWFSYRYLIFKENRDELLTKIEELKKQVIGSSDD